MFPISITLLLRWHIYFKSFSMVDKFILHSQCRGWWRLGGKKNQSVTSNIIDSLDLPEHSSSSSARLVNHHNWSRWSGTSLVQATGSSLFGAKPLLDAMLTVNWNQMQGKNFESEQRNSLARHCLWKYHQSSFGHRCQRIWVIYRPRCTSGLPIICRWRLLWCLL